MVSAQHGGRREKFHSTEMFFSPFPIETHVDIEDSVRGKDVFIVQTGSWSVLVRATCLMHVVPFP